MDVNTTAGDPLRSAIAKSIGSSRPRRCNDSYDFVVVAMATASTVDVRIRPLAVEESNVAVPPDDAVVQSPAGHGSPSFDGQL